MCCSCWPSRAAQPLTICPLSLVSESELSQPAHQRAYAIQHPPVVRVMPNTPCLVGETAAAMCIGGKVGHRLAVNASFMLAAITVAHRLAY